MMMSIIVESYDNSGERFDSFESSEEDRRDTYFDRRGGRGGYRRNWDDDRYNGGNRGYERDRDFDNDRFRGNNNGNRGFSLGNIGGELNLLH